MAEKIFDIEDRFYKRAVRDLFRNFTNETDTSTVRAWADLHDFCLCDQPKSPLAIINHCTAEQILFLEENVTSTYPAIKQYATEIVDTLEAACQAEYKMELDTYLESIQPGPQKAAVKLAEVIDISRFRPLPGPQTM